MARISALLLAPGVVLVLASAAPADPVRDAVSWQAMPAGVADAAGELGFVANANRNVVAVNLANGKETWAGARGDYPVAIVGSRVLVLNADADKPNVLRMTSFDTQTGKTGVRSDPIAFPDWMDLRPGGEQSFGLLSRIDGGDLWMHWRARAGKKEATGAVHIDLQSGKVDMLAADKMPPPAPALPLTPALTKLVERPYNTPAGPETNVLTAGGFAVAVDVEKDGARQKVTLRRWDAKTEREQDAVTLARGGPFQVTLSPAAGMVSIRPAADPKRPAAGRWTVFALETGKRRAGFAVEPGTLDAAVVGGRLLYTYLGPAPPVVRAPPGVTGRVLLLKAVDLDTGEPTWWKALDPDNPFWRIVNSWTTGDHSDDS